MLDDELECGSTDEKGGRGTRRVVKYSTNVNVLDLVERINSLDTVCVELMEDEGDSGTTRKFDAGKFLVVSLEDCLKIR